MQANWEMIKSIELHQAQATERSKQVEAATTKVANNVGKKKSKRELLITACSGKHTISLGKSKGILTPLQGFENEEDGDMANTKATPVARDTNTTVTINRSVHVTALSNGEGTVDATRRKNEWKQTRDMIVGN